MASATKIGFANRKQPRAPCQQAARLLSLEFERRSEEALQGGRKTILQLRNDAIINDEVLRQIQQDIDLTEARLRRHQ